MMKLEELYNQKESQRLEFKESFGKDSIETITSFSNAAGGIILIGIDKQGAVKGVNITNEILKDWVNVIKQATQPQIFPEINPVVIEGKTIVCIVVQEYPIKPVSCKGKYYKRIGASNHLIPLNEIAEMQLYSINSSFDSFTVWQTLADLQMDLIVNFFRQIGNTGRIRLYDDPVVNLRKIGLLKGDQLTFAALLLFGEHQTGIHIGRFKSPDVIIDDILIQMPLAAAVDEAMMFIKKSISIRYEFTGELRRKEIWQYPLPVIREILLNAIIHRDYRDPTDIMIKIFDDHIRFINPGSLMGGLRVEDLLKGEYVALHRNKLLAEAFYLRGEIEKFGTGLYRIQTELQNYPELRFNFEELNGVILCGLEIVAQGTPHDTPHDTPHNTPHDTPEEIIAETSLIKNLLLRLDGEMSRPEILLALKLHDRFYLRETYLKPALTAALIEMTIPDKPRSKRQKYRLTLTGKQMREKLESSNKNSPPTIESPP